MYSGGIAAEALQEVLGENHYSISDGPAGVKLLCYTLTEVNS